MIELPIKKGDTVKMGKFKNKPVVIKSIKWNEKGDLLINDRPALKFRLFKTVNIFDKGFTEDIKRDSEGYGKYKEPMDSEFDEPSKTKKLEGKSTYKKIMEME
ncbi:hypothetical protein HOE22_03690 [Candidatus Woesearchaeota archaeon]|jgi:hypothetical protein|nr:hypothetical protein [Candidatus Woesearchaeota archaeon]MBT4732274.1 hypothetical protein [Candidatus Woesearchaeota archaeon]MBT7557252.1 hypothetical protein [Candidatus Woesearchaeota archaeon]